MYPNQLEYEGIRTAIAELECDVTTWTAAFCGISVWPIIRSSFHFASFKKLPTKQSDELTQSTLRLNIRGLYERKSDIPLASKSDLRVLFVSKLEHGHQVFEKQIFDKFGDAIFFSLPVNILFNKVLFSGGIIPGGFNFICDPLRYNLIASSIGIRPSLQELDSVKALLKKLDKVGLKVSVPRVFDILKRVALVSSGVEPLIRLYCPTVVIQTCFYNILSYGISARCRMMGIPVIDYQHGLQGSGSLVYHNWNLSYENLPKKHFLPLPNSFVTWTSDERDRILDSWSNGGITAFCTGNLFYTLFPQFFLGSRKTLQAYKALIVLAPLEIDPLIITLINSMPNITWLLRPHPSDARSREDFEDYFSSRLEHTSWELSQKFRAIDTDLNCSFVVITGQSTVFYEASELGIATIILNLTLQVPESISSRSNFYQTRDSRKLREIVLHHSENIILVGRSEFTECQALGDVLCEVVI